MMKALVMDTITVTTLYNVPLHKLKECSFQVNRAISQSSVVWIPCTVDTIDQIFDYLTSEGFSCEKAEYGIMVKPLDK